MFQAYLVAALCIVLASVSQIQAVNLVLRARTTTGRVCETAWLPPKPNTSDKGNLCIGRAGWFTCENIGVNTDFDRKAPTGKGCTRHGVKVDSPVCAGGFQRRAQLYECYTKIGSTEYARCESVEAMFGTGGECDKPIVIP